MNWAGFTIAMFGLAVTVLILVFNKQLRVITKYYWFWLAIGLFCFIWQLVWKWVPDIIKYHNLLQTKFDPSTKHNSGIISNALLLEVCPFFSVFIPLALIVDPSRKLARAMAPFAFMGGIMIVFGQIPFIKTPQWGLKYLFIEDGLYAFSHLFLLWISFGILLNTPKYGWKGYISFICVAAFFYIYVLICMKATGCRHYVSGLVLSEWETSGPYYFMARITGWKPIVCMCLTLPGLCVIASAIVWFSDYFLHRFKRFRYGNFRTDKFYIWYNCNIHTKE